MRYFLLDLTATLAPEYCSVDGIDGCDAASLMIAVGESALARYPGPEVVAHLKHDHLGLKLPTRIGNWQDLLLVSRDAVERLSARLEFGRHELFPFTLLDHKRRVHARDHLMVNALERREIAHPATEFKRYPSTGRVFDCERWVLALERLDAQPDLPDLFRSAEFPRAQFVSERFVQAVNELGLSNFEFVELPHQ